jgi:hypothetical protein
LSITSIRRAGATLKTFRPEKGRRGNTTASATRDGLFEQMTISVGGYGVE